MSQQCPELTREGMARSQWEMANPKNKQGGHHYAAVASTSLTEEALHVDLVAKAYAVRHLLRPIPQVFPCRALGHLASSGR